MQQSAESVKYDLIFFLLLSSPPPLSMQTMLTAISMSAIATNGVVPGGWADAGTTQSSLSASKFLFSLIAFGTLHPAQLDVPRNIKSFSLRSCAL